MKNLDALINDIEMHIPRYEKINPTISTGSVGWHMEHTMLTLNQVVKAVKASDPDQYKYTFSLKRTIVCAIGKIPRGKVKAPEIVRPSVQFNQKSLLQHLNGTKENLIGLDVLKPEHYFRHPFLGNLNVKETKRFLQVHTAHHLKIIDDIIGGGS